MKEPYKNLTVVREVVGEEAQQQRIDNYLLRVCKGVPKSHIYRVLRRGEVRVNSRRVDPTYRLALGDEVRIPPLRMDDSDRTGRPVPVGEPFRILFEDDALLAIDKPAGFAVHGGSGVSFGVIERLRRQRPDARFLELVHRLDRETSGVLLVAKKRSALVGLHDQLRLGEVRKTYAALVRGRWMNPLQAVRLPLHKYVNEDGERRVAVSAQGKAAHSIMRLQTRWRSFSQLEVELKTGRTHQIRVHLAHLGFPLCGDAKYGDFALNKALLQRGLKRMYLHARRLEFCHPLSGDTLTVEAPLAADLTGFLARLDAEEARDDVTSL